MAQGRVYRLLDGPEWVCRIQTDLGLETPYILVAPVVPQSDWGPLVPKLHIPVLVEGDAYVIAMSQLVAIPGSQLGPIVGDVSAWRDDIIAAVDLLVSGF